MEKYLPNPHNGTDMFGMKSTDSLVSSVVDQSLENQLWDLGLFLIQFGLVSMLLI